eukprot:751683-Hanusia_phi.AAC.6
MRAERGEGEGARRQERRGEERRAEQSRAEESRAEESRGEQSSLVSGVRKGECREEKVRRAKGKNA